MNWHHPHRLARRAQITGRVIVAVFAVLLATFFRLQVLGEDRYAFQSEQNRLRPVDLAALRGLITDRNGVVLADNVPGFTVSLIAPSAESLQVTLERIAPLARLDSAHMQAMIQGYREAPHNPVVVMRDAPLEVVSALEERRVAIPGLVVQTEPKRRYPVGELVAHILGYVSEITESELASRRFEGAKLATQVGRSGLERAYDDRLRGIDGVRFVEVDARGRTIRDHGVFPEGEPQQGEHIRTTIDIELQRYVADVFPEGMQGAVLAMDPRNGDILAMHSAPSYDPNEFIGGIDPDLWRELREAESKPLYNRAIQGIYPPASPWKLVIASMALEQGIVTLDSKMPLRCRGGLQFYNRFFRCWRTDGHGALTLVDAIRFSCDVYFYQLGQQLGVDRLLQGGAALGFGSKTGVDLPNEITPLYPQSTEYFDRRYGPRGWTSAVALNLAIGQGENSQTLINMVRFYSMLANADGSSPLPRLVPSDRVMRGPRLGLSEEELTGLREALVAVVEGGTAARSRIANLRIAGKTGTAQNSHGPDHGWFIAFAPADDPRVVAGAIIEFAEHGSDVAPMVTNIIARHLLGPESAGDRNFRLVVPSDSAPLPIQILPDTIAQDFNTRDRDASQQSR
jgi:penicillin-binding protein 2